MKKKFKLRLVSLGLVASMLLAPLSVPIVSHAEVALSGNAGALSFDADGNRYYGPDTLTGSGVGTFYWHDNVISTDLNSSSGWECSSSGIIVESREGACLEVTGNVTGDYKEVIVNSTGAGSLPGFLVDSGVSVSLDSFSMGSGANARNEGTFSIAEFNPSTRFINNGTVNASSMTISKSTANGSTGKYVVSSGGTLALSGFSSGETFGGTIQVPYNATMTSTGGTFTLDIVRANGTIKKGVTFSSAVSGKKLSDIAELEDDLKENVKITFTSAGEQYLGTNLKVTVIAEGEDGRYLSSDDIGEIKYSYMGSSDTSFKDGLPNSNTLGTYTIRAKIEENEYFFGAYKDSVLKVIYMPLSQVDKTSSGNYVDVSGLKNGKYSSGKITFTPSSGYKVADNWGAAFGDTVEATKAKLFTDGYYNADYGIYFKNDTSGGETDAHTLATLGLDLSDVVFDEVDPAIIGTSKLDGKAVTVSDGAEFTGKALSFTIEDNNLNKVEVNGVAQAVNSGRSEVVIEAVPGDDGNYGVYAEDLAGRTLEFSVKLIYKKDVPKAEVSISDVFVGNEYGPVLTTDSNGKDSTVFEYKKVTDPEDLYDEEKPTAVGEYMVRATVPETDLYEEAVCTDTFKIIKYTPSVAQVVVPDTTVGTDYDPVLTTDSDGKDSAVFEYKKEGADDSTFTTTKPVKAGNYVVRATVPETEKYEKVVCTSTFIISKKALGKSSVKVPDTTVGTEYEPVLTTDSDGKADAVFEYKKYGADDETFSMKKPTKAGKYTVRATVPATDNYDEVVVKSSFTISKKPVSKLEISVEDVFVGQKYDVEITTDSDGKDKAVIEYKKSSEEEDAYTEEKPTEAGKYTVRVTIPETATYEGASETADFSIKRYSSNAELSIGDVYAGTEYAPKVTTNSDCGDDIIFEYKPWGTDDSEYVQVQPLLVGKYEVRGVLPDTEKYEGAVCKGEFSIIYLEAPETVYTLSGTEGKNGWYVSDVNVVAADGFTIATSFMGSYSGSVTYSDSLGNVYLRRTSDGALTDAIGFNEKLKIDKEAPEFMQADTQLGDVAGVLDGTSIYADDYVIRVIDDHLAKVTLNDSPVNLAGQRTDIMLDSENGTKGFIFYAEDEAGNVSRFGFTMNALWLKSKLIPANKKLPLVSSEQYFLGDGSWIVSGDKTVYRGGGSVFVDTSGDYTFTMY